MVHCWWYDSVWPYEGIYNSQTFDRVVSYISKAAKYGGNVWLWSRSITKWNKTGAAGGSGLFMASVYVEIFQKHTFLTYLAFTCSHNKCEAKKIISAKHGEVWSKLNSSHEKQTLIDPEVK